MKLTKSQHVAWGMWCKEVVNDDLSQEIPDEETEVAFRQWKALMTDREFCLIPQGSPEFRITMAAALPPVERYQLADIAGLSQLEAFQMPLPLVANLARRAVAQKKKDSAAPQVGRSKRRALKVNPKDSQTVNLVSYLTGHHEYNNCKVGNYAPAESRDIVKKLKAAPGTVSDFLKREFPSSGKPRDGYVKACRGQAELLLWLITRNGDRLPNRNADLDSYDEGTIRERW
jgi:hypothetical protein